MSRRDVLLSQIKEVSDELNEISQDLNLQITTIEDRLKKCAPGVTASISKMSPKGEVSIYFAKHKQGWGLYAQDFQSGPVVRLSATSRRTRVFFLEHIDELLEEILSHVRDVREDVKTKFAELRSTDTQQGEDF